MTILPIKGRTGIVVAARYSSSRLPGKAMIDFGGHSLLGFLLTRLQSSLLADTLILATSTESSDDIIEAEAKKYNTAVYRGDLNDVVARYVGVAETFDLQTLVRVTGDNPFLDGAYVDDFISQIIDAPETLFTTRPACPKGLNVEIFSADMLRYLHNIQNLSNAHREHLTSWFYTEESPWQPIQLKLPKNWIDVQGVFSVDTLEDYKMASSYLESFKDIHFSPVSLIKELMN